MSMRKKRFSLLCLIGTALAITALLAACKPPTTGGNNPPDNPGTNTDADGFVTGTTTVEDLSKELIGGINSALRPASTEHLGTASPYASIYNEWQMSINDKEAKLTVAIDYDHDKTLAKEPEATRLAATLAYEGQTQPELEVYFYSDELSVTGGVTTAAENDRMGGNMYVSLGGAKICLPLFESSLTELLPLNMLGSIIPEVLSACLNFNDLKHSYREEEGSKRTRRYSVEIDVKQTLSKLLSYFDRNSEYRQYLQPVIDLIEALFGAGASDLKDKMPETTLKVDFETTGGLRNSTGSGRLSDINMQLNVAASDNTDTIFGGREYNVTADMLTCEVKASPIDPSKLPPSDDARFEDYFLYDKTAMHVDGKIRYLNTNSVFEAGKNYDIDLIFQYCGLEADDPDSTIKLTITDPDDVNYVPLDLSYVDGQFSIAMQEKNGATIVSHSLSYNADFKSFLDTVIDSFRAKDNMSILEVIAFIFDHLRVTNENGEIFGSLICDEDFFLKTLGFGDGKGTSQATDPLEEFIYCLQMGYKGTGTLSALLKNNGIDFGKYVFDSVFEVSLSISEDFFELMDERELETLVADPAAA